MDEKIKDHSKVSEDHKNNTISISLQSVRELKNEIGLIAVFKNTFKYYKIRRVTNKGAILVLLLSYLVSSIYYLFFHIIVSHLHYSTKFYSCLWLITFSVSASLSGWLADAFIGRYKVIKNSVLIMWLFVVLATVSVIIAQFADSHYHLITEVLVPGIFCVIGLGLGSFQATIVQFGLDQLQDASATEITVFIVWYSVTIIVAGIIISLNFPCLINQHYYTIIYLFVCVKFTVALLLLMCCNHNLIKEPSTKNPFKLIYQVMKFVIKNKHPRCRSAFTYCEDELTSRIDFGKSKYGGPFTTEQVEDVKTFFKILPLIATFGTLFGGILATINFYTTMSHFLHFYNPYIDRESLSHCYLEGILSNSGYFVVTILIILNEIIIYPNINRICVYIICCPRIKSLSKVIIGAFLQLLCLVVLILLDILSRHIQLNNNRYNTTLECDFYRQSGIQKGKLSTIWLVLTSYLQNIAFLFIMIGIIEFLYSQSPYSMRGLIFGMQYMLMILLSVPAVIIIGAFREHFSIWGTKTISCGFWYMLTVIVIYSIVWAIFLCLTKKYKMRKREDVLPNENFFAERYYETLET